ncbi:hypothetical protein [Vampirovibrio chlorellavorus]|uniref:hypothetical protein n=1 Tax=Vampirovibrio chlorellavorus TaxID=758823 RepID=UPI0026F158E4|nr:hypothetical protein [Vampirovibrio chlorellavorus]
MLLTCKPVNARILALLIILSGLLCGRVSHAQESNLVELNRSSYGSRFYMDKNTIQAAGDGTLRYRVIELQPGQSKPGRVNQSEVDCNTGQLKSSMSSWEESSDGKQSNPLPGPSRPVKISSYSSTHAIFKNICNQYAPEAKGSW